MATESKHGLIWQGLRATTSTGRSMASGTSSGLTAPSTPVNSSIITSTERASTPGSMAANTRENGARTKCMEKDCSCGPMVESISDSTSTTRNVVTANLYGLISEATVENGLMANNTEKAPISTILAKKSTENG